MKSDKKILYLIASPLSPRDYERFGIDTWLERSWEVAVFDFTKLLRPDFYEYIDGDHLSVRFSGLTIVKDLEEAYTSISNFGAKFGINLLHGSEFEREIIKNISKQIKLIKLTLGSIPLHKSTLTELFKKGIRNPSKVSSYIQQKVIPVKTDSLHVVGGTASIPANVNKDEIIYAHNWDYDIYIKSRKETLSEHILFLDEEFPFHPDFVFSGITPPVSPEKYYPEINKYLRKVQRQKNLPVIVALHPRANKTRSESWFEFDCIQFNTFELVQKSSIVLLHCSTSIQFPILLEKKIRLLTTNEIEKTVYGKHIEMFAKEIGQKKINISNCEVAVEDEKIDKVMRNNYIKKYIKCGGPKNSTVWDIIISKFDKKSNQN